MKKTVTLELEDGDDAVELMQNVRGTFKGILYDLDQWLRQKVKYENQDKIDITEVRSEITRLCRDEGVDVV